MDLVGSTREPTSFCLSVAPIELKVAVIVADLVHRGAVVKLVNLYLVRLVAAEDFLARVWVQLRG